MKEDVLEQVVDDYLQSLGFLTRSNVRFRPSPAHPDYVVNQDSVHSDVDVLGFAPDRYGADRVWVVSCKAWQEGLDPGRRLDELRTGGKEWRRHRELWSPKWGEALCDTVEQLTGQRAFRYFTAVTKLKGQVGRWHEWRDEPQIRQCLEGNWVGFLRLQDMWQRTVATSTTTLAGSVMGRLAQMLIAAGQATVTPDDPEADEQLTRPHEQEDDYTSLAGMWVPPPPVFDAEGINRYGHTVQGYEYARLHYAVEASPEGLDSMLKRLATVPRVARSFEMLRLEQFFQVRGWHHVGCLPTAGEETERALHLHYAIEAAWANQHFDRGHKSPLKMIHELQTPAERHQQFADRMKGGPLQVMAPDVPAEGQA